MTIFVIRENRGVPSPRAADPVPLGRAVPYPSPATTFWASFTASAGPTRTT